MHAPKFDLLIKGAATAVLLAALSLPSLGQNGGGGTGGGSGTGTGMGTVAGLTTPFLNCTLPLLPPGTTTSTGSTSNFGAPYGGFGSGFTSGQVTCGVPGQAVNTSNLAFAAEGTVPSNFVLAPVQPGLPDGILANVIGGVSELRQFITFSGNILTVDLAATPAGSALPTPVTATVAPGSLITELRFLVQSVVVGGGNMSAGTGGTGTGTGAGGTGSGSGFGTGTGVGTTAAGAGTSLVFSGIVLPSNTGTANAWGTAPLAPNLFGSLEGSTGTVSLAFNSPISWPGLGSTPVSGATGTGAIGTGTNTGPGANGMFNGLQAQGAPVSMIAVSVAGAFVYASPSGFAAVSFPEGSSSTGGPGTGGTGPVIVVAPFSTSVATPQIQLDVSQSTSSVGGPLTFTWTTVGTPQAAIIPLQQNGVVLVQFGQIGTYVIQVTATDAAGAATTTRFIINYLGLPG